MTAKHDSGRADEALLELDGRTVRLARPGKVLFPETGFTKRELVSYYLSIADAILPHLRGRPLTFARWPDGVEGPGFFQSNAPRGHPPWLPVIPIATRAGEVLRYPLVGDRAALAWIAGAAAIELHPFLWTVDRPGAPRVLVLDLDPGPPAGFGACARVGLRVRERLAADGLEAVPKASGGKGLHLLVPLDGTQTFAQSKAYARALAEALAGERPDEVVARMGRAERAGKVLVDWRQNDPGLSTVAPWSLRGTRTPVVSAPLRWDEVDAAAAGGEPPRIGPADALARLERDGDPFRAVPARRVPSQTPAADPRWS